MLAHEPAYEQMSVRLEGGCFVLEGAVDSLADMALVETFMRRVLGPQMRNELYLRSAEASGRFNLSTEQGNFRVTVEFYASEANT